MNYVSAPGDAALTPLIFSFSPSFDDGLTIYTDNNQSLNLNKLLQRDQGRRILLVARIEKKYEYKLSYLLQQKAIVAYIRDF